MRWARQALERYLVRLVRTGTLRVILPSGEMLTRDYMMNAVPLDEEA